jgi:hypothetical protein
MNPKRRVPPLTLHPVILRILMENQRKSQYLYKKGTKNVFEIELSRGS